MVAPENKQYPLSRAASIQGRGFVDVMVEGAISID